MMRAWFGVALLAGSWLWGLDYFYAGSTAVWLALVVLGTLALAGDDDPLAESPTPRGRTNLLAILLTAVAVWGMPWPYRAAPLGLVLGLAAPWIRLPGVRRFAQGAALAGAVLLVQGIGLEGYAALTSRSHDLPEPLVDLLGTTARILGADVSIESHSLALRSQRQVQHLATTWELLVDPALVAFFVGGALLLGFQTLRNRPSGARRRAWASATGQLALIVAVWALLRAALMMGVYVQRDLMSAIDAPAQAMNHLFSPWLLLALLAVPALLASRLVRVATVAAPPQNPRTRADESPSEIDPTTRPWHVPASVGLIAIAAALGVVALYWEPVGQPQDGRVMFVERHSTWEPSDRGYDTKVFGEDSGYNYSALYDYASRFFEMSRLRENEPIDGPRLSRCSVLVIKTPTAAYTPDEVQAVVRFVEQGGGLLLIGEHTNFSKSTQYLNAIGRHFGFRYRNDLLFGLDSAYEQSYRAPIIPHPAVQHVDRMDFAVSCSVEPGWDLQRAALRSTGLWSLPPDYNMSNFFPVPQHRPEMRYGAFVQLWATRFGQGRVVAFTDSTIFSNFCAFEPGKAELFLNMVAWLNHRDGMGNPRILFLAAALASLVYGLRLGLRHKTTPWALALGAALATAVLTGQAVAAAHRWALPPPTPKRPMIRVAIDRTLSDVPLAKGGFITGHGEGYGLLEQWIGRLGYFTARRTGEDAFDSDVLVVICPTRSVPEAYRRRLERYVSDGGKLLLLDSPENVSSTANGLLWPLGLSIYHDRRWRGDLLLGDDLPRVNVDPACEMWGGTTVARIGPHPVAVTARHGKGTIMALGFASLFSDRNLGMAWTVEPSAEQRQRYDLLFAVMRALVEGRNVSELWEKK